MRIRALIIPLLLLLPELAGAQLRPRVWPRGSDPQQPQPLPPEAEPVARALGYRRLRLSAESFPLVSHARSAGFRGGSWTSAGMGTHADYRITTRWSAVAEVTSSWAGSAVATHTAEIGTRFRPYRLEGRAQPFVDLRFGYAGAYERRLGSAGAYAYGNDPAIYGRRSDGWGVVGGAGTEYALTRQFSLTTAAAVMRSAMTLHDFSVAQGPYDFAMTTYRLTFGLRYNPVRLVMAQDADRR